MYESASLLLARAYGCIYIYGWYKFILMPHKIILEKYGFMLFMVSTILMVPAAFALLALYMFFSFRGKCFLNYNVWKKMCY